MLQTNVKNFGVFVKLLGFLMMMGIVNTEDICARSKGGEEGDRL